MNPLPPEISERLSPIHVRRSSGLVRGFAGWDSFVFNVLGFAPGFSITLLPGLLAGSYPRANAYVVIALGALLALFNGATYAMLAATMPRSGGDYVFISRVVRPWVGFAASWGFFWSQVIGIGYYACLLITDVLRPSVLLTARITGTSALDQFAGWLNRPGPLAVSAVAVLAATLGLSVLGMRVIRRVLNISLVVALAGTATMLWALLSHERAEFVSRFNVFAAQNGGGPDAYGTLLARAGDALPADGGLWASLAALAVGYWVFIGFTYSAYVAGEVRKPSRSQVVGILGALAFGVVFYVGFIAAYHGAVGSDFVRAVAAAEATGSAPYLAGGSVLLFAELLVDSSAARALISVATVLWFATVLVVIAQVAIRVLFAWAVDRLVPVVLMRVAPRSGTPWVAACVVLGLAAIFVFGRVFLRVALLDYVIALFSVCFLITGVAAMLLPARRPDLLEGAPRFVRRTVFGLPSITVAGAGNTALFLLVLYSAFAAPGVTGPGGWAPAVFISLIYASGVLLYWSLARVRRRRLQFDFATLYEELPPE